METFNLKEVNDQTTIKNQDDVKEKDRTAEDDGKISSKALITNAMCLKNHIQIAILLTITAISM